MNCQLKITYFGRYEPITNWINSMRLIKLKEAIEKTSLGRSTIYEFMTKGTFPKQVSLGAKSVAWLESEVDDWIMERLGERDS
jgi:prophage regulatory protein